LWLLDFFGYEIPCRKGRSMVSNKSELKIKQSVRKITAKGGVGGSQSSDKNYFHYNYQSVLKRGTFIAALS
jgi:hypothetical protein